MCAYCDSLNIITKEARAQLELNLAKDIKDNKKDVCKYINNKRKRKDNMGLLLSEGGILVTEDIEKAELLNAAFAMVFTGNTSPQGCLTQEIRIKECYKGDFPLVKEGKVLENT